MKQDEYVWEIKELFPSQLKIDNRYQRDIKDSQIKKAIKNFNINIINPPKVNLRDDGFYYIMDGDHTVTIWKQQFGNKPIKCRVYTGLTWTEEAEIFIAQNGVSSTVTTKEKLRSGYNMGSPEIVDMVERAKMCGVDIAFGHPGKSNNKCYAVDTMYYVYCKSGPSVFQEILDILVKSFGGERESLQSGFLKGMCKFFELYKTQFKKDVLIEKLRVNPVTYYIREAKTMPSGSLANRYCRAFMIAYNKHMKNRLPDVLS